MNKNKIIAIDIEESKVESSGVAYYRLTPHMRDFFDLCNKKHGIIGFEYEEGSFNFGVILSKDKTEETIDN